MVYIGKSYRAPATTGEFLRKEKWRVSKLRVDWTAETASINGRYFTKIMWGICNELNARINKSSLTDWKWRIIYAPIIVPVDWHSEFRENMRVYKAKNEIVFCPHINLRNYRGFFKQKQKQRLLVASLFRLEKLLIRAGLDGAQVDDFVRIVQVLYEEANSSDFTKYDQRK